MWAPTRGALVGLGAWVCLMRLLDALWLVSTTLLLLLLVAAVLREAYSPAKDCYLIIASTYSKALPPFALL